MPKEAKPDRYLVDRLGTPDPEEAEYYVLDLVHDVFAREVAWMLVRKYRNANGANGQSVRADELEQLLRSTTEANMRYVEARQVSTTRKVGRPKSARPRS